MGWVILMFCLGIGMFISAIIAANSYEEGLAGILGLFSLIFIAISIGMSIEKDMTTKWVKTEVDWVKTNRMVIVDDGEKIWEFESYEDVTSINDSTEFYHLHTTNFWGVEDIEGIKYENKITK